MKKIAIQLIYGTHWRELIDATAEAGFSYVAIAFGEPDVFQKDDWRDRVREVRDALDSRGLRTIMTHAPYYDLFITAETLDPAMERGLFRAIEATEILGAPLCAVHPRTAFFGGEAHGDLKACVDVKKSLECNAANLAPLVKEAEKRGVLLGIENLMQYPNCPIPFYSCNDTDHIELIEKLHSDNVCAVWDFGHANLGNPDQASSIRRLGGRIQGTHVHNNDGIQDEHFPPFIPSSTAHYIRRTVDWRNTLSALKATGYTGYLTLEPAIDHNYPIKAHIRYLYESVSALDDIMQNS